MIDTIERDVKMIILRVAGLPENLKSLRNDTYLWDLGERELMCEDLADEFDKYVKSKYKGVTADEVSTAVLVADCIKLVKDKLRWPNSVSW